MKYLFFTVLVLLSITGIGQSYNYRYGNMTPDYHNSLPYNQNRVYRSYHNYANPDMNTLPYNYSNPYFNASPYYRVNPYYYDYNSLSERNYYNHFVNPYYNPYSPPQGMNYIEKKSRGKEKDYRSF